MNYYIVLEYYRAKCSTPLYDTKENKLIKPVQQCRVQP